MVAGVICYNINMYFSCVSSYFEVALEKVNVNIDINKKNEPFYTHNSKLISS